MDLKIFNPSRVEYLPYNRKPRAMPGAIHIKALQALPLFYGFCFFCLMPSTSSLNDTVRCFLDDVTKNKGRCCFYSLNAHGFFS